MRKLVVPFLLFFFILLSISVKATYQQFDYSYVVADSYVASNHPTWNFGYGGDHGGSGYWALLVENTTGGWDVESYIMFNVIGTIPYGSTITDAYISLFQGAGTSTPVGGGIWAYNTSINWTETNITWDNNPTIGTLQSTTTTVWDGVGQWNNFTVKNALIAALANNASMSILLKENYTGSAYQSFYSAQYSGTTARPVLYVDYSVTDCISDCGGCGCIQGTSQCNLPKIVGSYCAVSEGLPNTIKTVPYANCTNITYFNCPNNTFCSQITPAINVSEYLSQSSGGMLDWCKGCWFINYRPDPIFHYNILAVYATNCWNTTSTPWTVYNECNCNQIGYCSSNIYETDNITNVPYSITQWSAGCFNPTTGKYSNVINGTGLNTTIETMINATCPDCVLSNNVTSQCLNTSTTCYDSNCNIVTCTINAVGSCNQANLDYTSGFNCGIAGLLNIHDIATANMVSAVFITLFGSLAVAALLVYLGVGGSMVGQSFLMSLLMLLVMFTFISWFPAWIMIILIVMGGLLVAKTLKVF